MSIAFSAHGDGETGADACRPLSFVRSLSGARHSEARGAFRAVQERQEEIRKIERTLEEVSEMRNGGRGGEKRARADFVFGFVQSKLATMFSDVS